jgi:hypothetical protein
MEVDDLDEPMDAAIDIMNVDSILTLEFVARATPTQLGITSGISNTLLMNNIKITAQLREKLEILVRMAPSRSTPRRDGSSRSNSTHYAEAANAAAGGEAAAAAEAKPAPKKKKTEAPKKEAARRQEARL